MGPNEYVEVYEHRLVAGMPPPWKHVHHKNGDKTDNRPENLEILDAEEHGAIHGHDQGRDPSLLGYRSAAGRDKALRAQARRAERAEKAKQAAEWYRAGATTGEIGERLGIHQSNVSQLLRKAGVEKAQGRMTGPSQATRKVVRARAGELCELCQMPGTQIHHRMPRQMGGSRGEEINLPSNLILLCLRCHGLIEANRERSYDLGLLVRRTVSDVAAVPVNLACGRVFLRPDGTYSPE